MAKQLLEQGFDVLMADLDAVWIRNPFEEIEKFNNSDIISSRGTFPEDVSRKLGAAVCMGFVYFKATAAIKELMGDVAQAMTKRDDADDQREINRVLLNDHSLSFPGSKLTYKGSTTANTGTAKTKGGLQYGVTLLPHESYRRICEGVPISTIQKSVVIHCLSAKDGSSKFESAATIGIWGLKDDYKDVPLVGPVDDFLDHITALKRDRRLLDCVDDDGPVVRSVNAYHAIFGGSASAAYLNSSSAVRLFSGDYSLRPLDNAYTMFSSVVSYASSLFSGEENSSKKSLRIRNEAPRVFNRFEGTERGGGGVFSSERRLRSVQSKCVSVYRTPAYAAWNITEDSSDEELIAFENAILSDSLPRLLNYSVGLMHHKA
jgi:hypothetical protein